MQQPIFLNATFSDNKFPSCFKEQSRSDLEREEKHPSLMFSDKDWDEREEGALLGDGLWLRALH